MIRLGPGFCCAEVSRYSARILAFPAANSSSVSGLFGLPLGYSTSAVSSRPSFVRTVTRPGMLPFTRSNRSSSWWTDVRVIIRLDGCSDRAAAEAMRGEELLVSRDRAPALEPDEWWAEDLEGCTILADGREIGVVKRLMALPSCEALEVQRGDGGQELLVPLVSDAVGRVDVERRTIEVDLEFLGVGPDR